MNKFNFAFFGTPDVARKTLQILFENGRIPSLIVTSPDARSGRGMHMNPSPVSVWAKEHFIPCIKLEKINQEFIDEFRNSKIDLSIVVAYGKILPEELIKIPTLDTINIHYSLLPEYRGASPVEQALLNGDTKTGITIQQMEFKLDTGGIIAQVEIPIHLDDTKEILREKLINLGAQTLVNILPDIIMNNKIDSIPQDETKATYCGKHKKEDGQIDPDGNAKENYNKYRAYEGWPGIFFFKDGKRMKIKK